MSTDDDLNELKSKLAETQTQLEEVQKEAKDLELDNSLLERQNSDLRSRTFIGFNPSLGGMRVTFGSFLGVIFFFLIHGPVDTYLDASSMEYVWFAYKWVYWPVLLIYSVIGYLTPEDD
tara:strand:+ start:3200 stop:3556 length:357 start_codon:yes stop_codon:yes gene_type:complete